MPGPGLPPGYYLVPSTNWWKLSGFVVFAGALMIGIGFIILGLEAVATSGYDNYVGAFYACIGVGIALIGLSWAFARMAPRVK
jgi:hypothetical protein